MLWSMRGPIGACALSLVALAHACVRAPCHALPAAALTQATALRRSPVTKVLVQSTVWCQNLLHGLLALRRAAEGRDRAVAL